MRVEVRLFASFREGRFKKRPMEVPDQTQLGDILRELGISAEDVSLPLINGRYSSLADRVAPDDVVSFFPAVGGG